MKVLLVAIAVLCMSGCRRPADCPSGSKHVLDSSDAGHIDVCRTPEGIPNGPAVWFYEKDRKRLEGVFENGDPSGAWTWWHPNGQKRSSMTFGPRAEAEGTWEEWYPDGKLSWQFTFKQGRPVGPAKMLWDNGGKRLEAVFVEGARAGLWTAWYRAGTKAGSGSYERDSPSGEWTVWSKKGTRSASREAGGEWKYLEEKEPKPNSDNSGTFFAGPYELSGVTLATMTPEYLPGITAGTYPWEKIHGVWFDEFRIELGLSAEDFE